VPSSGIHNDRLQMDVYVRIYTGSTILDLFDLVERAERSSRWQKPAAETSVGHAATVEDTAAFTKEVSETEEFSQTSRLRAANRDLSLFLVVHPQLIGAFEPGDNFADAVDVHEVGAMSPPK
jgi:hypothetical protein